MAKRRRPRDREKWNRTEWMNECDKLFDAVIRHEGRCEVCATLLPQDRVRATQFHAHHLISRARRGFRHLLVNGICLCARHHTFDPHLSAHGAPWAFEAWMKTHKPEQHKWWVENRDTRRRSAGINYRHVHTILHGRLTARKEKPVIERPVMPERPE